MFNTHNHDSGGPPQDSLEAWRQHELQYAERLAQAFADSEVGRERVPFDDNSMMDPPFKATLLKHCTAHPGAAANRQLILIVLTDWWKSQGPGRNGAVESNVDYFEQCFRGEYRGDLAFRQLFENQPNPKYGIPKGWVYDVVHQGRAIVTNAVLGMRKGDSAVGPLSPEEHYTGMTAWWLPLARELKPTTVFLCGEWAITRLALPDRSESTPRAIAYGELGPNTVVKHVPHPRGWVRNYTNDPAT